jgi:catechol 2,3-dioxygenase-like lactoylglutathione lyase family enzyme
MISHVAKVGVSVRDQQRALEFFTQKLGFDLITDVPMGEKARWIEVRPPGAQTALALWTPPGLENRIGTFSGVVFQAADVHKAYGHLIDKGVTFTQTPTLQPGGTMGLFVDADGNTFVLRGLDR